MSRYIDADEFEKRIKPYDTDDEMDKALYNFAHNMMMCTPTADVVNRELYDRLLENGLIISEALDKYQTADFVEVVRCKDCHHLEILNGENYYARCKQHGRLFDRFGNADTRTWFCADGKRRGNE